MVYPTIMITFKYDILQLSYSRIQVFQNDKWGIKFESPEYKSKFVAELVKLDTFVAT